MTPADLAATIYLDHNSTTPIAPEVAAAMADKYWSDIFIRWFPHPLTLRLVPDVVSAVAATAAPRSPR